MGGVGVAKWGPSVAIRRPYHESEVFFKGDLAHTLLDAFEYTVQYYCPRMKDLGRKFGWIVAFEVDVSEGDEDDNEILHFFCHVIDGLALAVLKSKKMLAVMCKVIAG